MSPRTSSSTRSPIKSSSSFASSFSIESLAVEYIASILRKKSSSPGHTREAIRLMSLGRRIRCSSLRFPSSTAPTRLIICSARFWQSARVRHAADISLSRPSQNENTTKNGTRQSQSCLNMKSRHATWNVAKSRLEVALDLLDKGEGK